MGFDDTSGDRKPETGSAVFMGDEGFEDGGKILGSNAAPVIGDDDLNHILRIIST
jgi:hypothetical protein